MALDDVHTIHIGVLKDGTTMKYLVFELTDPSGRSKIIVRAVTVPRGKQVKHNEVIFRLNDELEKDGSRITHKVLGGGFLFPFTFEKLLSVTGSSSNFGADPDPDRTCRILQEQFPHRKVQIV